METYLAHHGILGQKWGIRRYQNEDGTLTEAGKRRYAIGEKRLANRDRYVDKKYDTVRNASRLGTFKNIQNTGRANAEAEGIRQASNAVRNSKENMIAFANKTLAQRVTTATGGTIATGAAFVAAAIAENSIPFGALAALPVGSVSVYLYRLTMR